MKISISVWILKKALKKKVIEKLSVQKLGVLLGSIKLGDVKMTDTFGACHKFRRRKENEKGNNNN